MQCSLRDLVIIVCLYIVFCLIYTPKWVENAQDPSLFQKLIDPYGARYRHFSSEELVELRDEAKRMFQHGYENYMIHAFPMDELDPIHCTGRGPDYDDPRNININDVLGDYSLTLMDTLDTLAIMGNISEFHRAVQLIIDYVSFDKDNTVQVFEATIRVLGGLLSAHLLLTDKSKLLGDFSMPDYENELLHMAHDLATRLLPAFEGTKTNIPYPRVNLRYGVPWDTVNDTCTAGAGSLLLEFGVLSRLLNDPTFEGLARRTNEALWRYRDNDTGLLGNLINIQTGEWIGLLSGLGAGLDSYYEYMIKSYILFGRDEDYNMFNESYGRIKEHMRRGRPECNRGYGEHPMYVNVHMQDGSTLNTWIDSLQAAFVGVQILVGDVEEAICAHAVYYNIWKKYGVLPERFNWRLRAPDVKFYPLRPEFAEATYFLYLATKNPFYLHVGQEIMENLNKYTYTKCGYATIHSVDDMSLEDRMESFFLSETCKYLYLLFDVNNPVNRYYSKLIFTTEGHILPVDSRFRRGFPLSPKPPRDLLSDEPGIHIAIDELTGVQTETGAAVKQPGADANRVDSVTFASNARNVSSRICCPSFSSHRRYSLPLEGPYMRQLERSIGLMDSSSTSPNDNNDDNEHDQ